jgi:putative ATP-dependent endonuclease of OLD family
VDTHLRWTRTSALGRISARDNSTGGAMALASRAARDAIANHKDESLTALTALVQAKLNEVGSGVFKSVQPGLDTSLSSTGGNLALYEANVPLTNFGLGSKRLAGLAVQQLAATNKSILLVDEIEHGLEPHRLVRLLQYLDSDPSYSQVFITTHSPVVVEQASTENLAILRNDSGSARVSFLPEGTGTTLRLRRCRPSSFLGRRIIVTEGKTEEGLVLEVIRRNDTRRLALGQSVAAGEGAVVQDGQGGSEVAPRAMALTELGYAVAAFLDSDDRTVDAKVAEAESAGVVVARWAKGNSTESQLTASLDAPGLSSLLQLGVEVRCNEATVLNDLRTAGLPESVESLIVDEWVAGAELDIAVARQVISKAMIEACWFKTLDAAEGLGAWILDHQDEFIDSTIGDVIETLQAFIYADPAGGPEEADGDE